MAATSFEGGKAVAPYALSLYLDMKEYGALLVAGGILDQPVWLWQIVKHAGIIYQAVLAEELEEAEQEEAAQQAISEAVREGLMKKFSQG